jgi:hypothetical protein
LPFGFGSYDLTNKKKCSVKSNRKHDESDADLKKMIIVMLQSKFGGDKDHDLDMKGFLRPLKVQQ